MSTIELGTLQAELGALPELLDIGDFTLVTVTGSFAQIATDGSEAGSGSLTFTLTQPMSNGTVTVTTAPLTVTLDADGSLSVVLPSNEDAATVPQGVYYGVTEQIGQPSDYFISVPSADGTVDLSLLRPGAAIWL